MAFTINHITLLGHITKDPELKMSKAGKPILKFSMATNHSLKKEDGSFEDVPTFHNVVVFGKIAEFLARELHKSSKVFVDGRLTISDYTDKDGVQKRWVEVFANNCIPCERTNSKPAQEGEAKPTEKMTENVDPKDIPF